MRLRSLSRLALTVAAALAISACGSSDSGPGRINVKLTDGPSVDYDAVFLDIQEVQIHENGGWLTLGTPDRVVDLLTLRNGVTTTLVTEKQIEAGHYTQMRLVLGPDNTVVLAGEGSVESRTRPLVVPSGQQSGVKLNVNFDVLPDTTVDVVLDLDVARSVFVHRTGASEKYMLRPVVSAVDVLLTGSISGVLTDAVTGAPLPDVEVMAQAIENGSPVIARSARTLDDGSYVLPYLPAGGTYHVVAQPIVERPPPAPVVAYAAQASQPFLIIRGTPTATWNAAFTAAPVGSVSGSITPPMDDTQADLVSLAQVLDAGGVPLTFIVQTTDGVVASGVETYAFPTVPVGPYRAWVTRKTVSATADETFTTGDVSDEFPVNASVTAATPLTVPQ
jgi:hypothetical protein